MVSKTTATAAPPKIAHMMGQEAITLERMIGVGMTLASFAGDPTAADQLSHFSVVAMSIRSEGPTGRLAES